jgi:type VI secretion system secreted protein VgrG
MDAALHQLEQANRLAKALADAATTATALPPDVQAQVDLLQQSLKQLAQAGILMSAPAGIGLTTPHTIQQSAVPPRRHRRAAHQPGGTGRHPQ